MAVKRRQVLSHRCGWLTDGGPCQHPVVFPGKKCWQHDASYTKIDLTASSEDNPIVWTHGLCTFQVVGDGFRVVCLEHDFTEAWGVITVLGGVKPCDGVQQQFEMALRRNTLNQVPLFLRPLVSYARTLVPPNMVNGRGEVIPAFFQDKRPPQIDLDTMKKWRANPSATSLKLVTWLEKHHVTPTTWKPVRNLKHVQQFVKAGVTCQMLEDHARVATGACEPRIRKGVYDVQHIIELMLLGTPEQLAPVWQKIKASTLYSWDKGDLPLIVDRIRQELAAAGTV